MIVLRVDPDLPAVRSLTAIAHVAMAHPGEHAIRVEVVTCGHVTRTVAFGPDWRADGSEACMAALREYGEASHR